MMREITFEIPGDPPLIIHASEQEDGTILFNLTVTGGQLGDLRDLHFNLADGVDINSLEAAGLDLTDQAYGRKTHLKMETDNKVKGVKPSFYDVGLDFGTPGIRNDDINSTSFVLSSTNDDPLTLDIITHMEFVARLRDTGEPGTQRHGKENISVKAPAAPDAIDDSITTDEDTAINQDSPNTNLLSNDTDKDGDTLTIVGVNGDEALVGSQFTLSTGGLLKVNSNGTFDFDPNGQYDDLAVGESRSDSFTYTITDELSDPNNQGFDTATVDILIEGRNDQPTAENITASLGEDDASVQGAFAAADLDTTDVLSFEILGPPEDNFGNQYGAVVNNGDGTFTFSPLDNFQFLGEGESRDVSFQYVAIDDSGALNATSDPESVTVTVEGAYDAPVSLINSVLFETQDQSMWASGDAFVLEPDLPFLGLEWNESGSTTIIASQTFGGAFLDGIADAVGWVTGAVADAWNWITGDDAEGIEVPSSITTPSVTLDAWTTGKVGLQPYFSMTSGDVDSQLPMEIAFIMPNQVEQGESFTIETGYSLDDGATFNTASPNVSLQLDLIFQFDAGLSVVIGSSSLGNGGSHPLFSPPAVDETFNLIDFSAEDIEYSQDFEGPVSGADLGNFTVGIPVINTEGTPDPVGSDTTLTSSGEDSIMSLTLDADGFLSEAVAYATGGAVAIPLEDSWALPIEGWGINVLTAYANYNIFDIELTGDLKAVQNFSLNIEDLPLTLALEDGSYVTGYSVGDDIALNAPTFDVDTEGDADGLLDYDVAVDMDAIFDNLTTLGFDLTLDMEALSANAGVSSDLFTGFDVGFGPVWDPDPYVLFSTDNFATVFDSDPGIQLMGINQETFTGQFDIA